MNCQHDSYLFLMHKCVKAPVATSTQGLGALQEMNCRLPPPVALRTCPDKPGFDYGQVCGVGTKWQEAGEVELKVCLNVCVMVFTSLVDHHQLP